MAERRAAPARRAEEAVNFMVVGWRRGWVLCVLCVVCGVVREDDECVYVLDVKTRTGTKRRPKIVD
jgi:hypothetical protein